MAIIHPTAIVHQNAELGKDIEIGPYTIVEADVVIGDGCRIRSHAMIDNGTRLGKNIEVFTGAVLGGPPQDLKYDNEKTYLEVGDNTTIREYATLNRGTTYSGKTVVGENCLLMAYVHVAHDCVLGRNVILSNSVNMAGHVIIDDYAGIGGLTAIHQFAKIGQHSFVGGGYRVSKDIPPYILAMGEPLQFGGLNAVGMARRGFSEETLSRLKQAYRIVFRSNLLKAQALEKLRSEFGDCPEVRNVVSFFEDSTRGVIRGR